MTSTYINSGGSTMAIANLALSQIAAAAEAAKAAGGSAAETATLKAAAAAANQHPTNAGAAGQAASTAAINTAISYGATPALTPPPTPTVVPKTVTPASTGSPATLTAIVTIGESVPIAQGGNSYESSMAAESVKASWRYTADALTKHLPNYISTMANVAQRTL